MGPYRNDIKARARLREEVFLGSFFEGGRAGRRYAVAVWLIGGGLAFILCFYHLSSALADGVFVPGDNDSFYQARRIIDALGDPWRVAQFDARMHVPEGSWITWPWAYAVMMAVLTKALMALTGAADPMTVLALIAPAWVFVNAALFLGICRRLGLSLPMQALAMLFFATLPRTQLLHRVGNVDHHFIEYSFVLATIYLGLRWFENLASRRRAIALGILLGAAPAFQNGLFVLQLPVLVTIGVLWVLRRPLDRGAVLAFSLALVAATAAFLAPSETFRNGEFSYYLHSWFHLYAAGSTALLCLLASRFSAAPLSAAALCAVLVALAVPVVTQLELGRDFLFTNVPYMDRILEARSIAQEVASGRWLRVTLNYSPLIWLLPVGIAGLAWRLRRDAGDARIYFFVQVLFGSFLLLQTLRLHYFGSFALILPICQLMQDARERHHALFASRVRAAAVAVTVVALVVAGHLAHGVGRIPLGNDPWYALTRPMFPALAAACRKAPGAVLADHNDGHHVRYHSDCSVIANNFLTTPHDIEKIRLSEELLAGSTAAALRRAPYVRYIFIKRADNWMDASRTCGVRCPENQGMRSELLAGPPPERLRLMLELNMRVGTEEFPIARLFEVLPP